MNITLSTVLPDPIDPRDYLFEANPKALLPSEVDLRPDEPPVEDQGSVGSCTAQATVGACEAFLQDAGQFQDLSRLFNYYTSRELLGPDWLKEDKGSTCRMALRAAAKIGIAPEVRWPYITANVPVRPSDQAYTEAGLRKIGGYYRIPVFGDPYTTPDMTTQSALFSIKYALAKGYPVVGSFMVGSKLLTLQKNDVYPAVTNDNPLIGGHAVVIVGYKQLAGNLVFIVRNSWGTNYCDGGYFLMSTNVITANTIDLWVVKGFAGLSTVGPDLVVEEPPPPPAPIKPTCDSTMKDVVTYIFQTKFGRTPKQAGLDFWAQGTLDYMTQEIVKAASPADKQYMDAHQI